ncbi:MAG: hypothetical protein ACTSU7_13140 [Candidatus Heimdallarchaeaceae archaeon]
MTLVPEEEVNKILAYLDRGKIVHELFKKGMRENLTISGQTLDFWESKYKMRIQSDNLTPIKIVELSMKLLEFNEEVSFHFASSTAKSQMIRTGTSAAYVAEFARITAEYKEKGGRLPGQETLKTMATISSQEVVSASAIAEIEVKFWKSILEHLTTCRKLLDNASINIAVDNKARANDKAMEAFANRNINANKKRDY